jgi:superfamily I DNA and/or RNA helicase
MLFSTVISPGASNGCINFLKSTGNLFNVAITRAKSSLVVVGNQDYCRVCGVPYLERFVEYVIKQEIISGQIVDMISS